MGREMSDENGFQLPTPGPEHELLKQFAGTFVSEVKMWMGPGDPMISSGKIVNSFQLDGLYLYQVYASNSTAGPFPGFAGYGYWGYNTTSKQYQGFWIDNASTAMQLETGTVDESGRVWEMKSEFVMPGSGVVLKKRTIFNIVDEDQHTMESFVTPPGDDEVRNMFITYKRA